MDCSTRRASSAKSGPNRLLDEVDVVDPDLEVVGRGPAIDVEGADLDSDGRKMRAIDLVLSSVKAGIVEILLGISEENVEALPGRVDLVVLVGRKIGIAELHQVRTAVVFRP